MVSKNHLFRVLFESNYKYDKIVIGIIWLKMLKIDITKRDDINF